MKVKLLTLLETLLECTCIGIIVHFLLNALSVESVIKIGTGRLYLVQIALLLSRTQQDPLKLFSFWDR